MGADPLLTILRAIVREVGAFLLEQFRRGAGTRVVEIKGDNDVALEADHQAQEMALRLVQRYRLGEAFLAEETPGGKPIPLGYMPGLLVCVDPLEGTDNFSRGVPLFGTTAALWSEGRWEAVAFYAPALGEMWEARRGGGAFFNGQPFRYSPGLGIRLAFNQWPDVEPAQVGQAVTRLLDLTRHLSTTYSDALDLAWTAAGRRSGLVFLYRRAAPWDIAPALIAQEAGLQVTALNGGPWCRGEGGIPVVEGGLLVAPPALHIRLRQALSP
ncbi:MAG: inositol monophosphatase family protein [Dehalococcoidia bacterium]|nr:inositol monophosphatase family protein [Dehalococcoidia bacterium]MDW8119641.1 inositol monophosphatase family protein [Chloroflexota bacterium]